MQFEAHGEYISEFEKFNQAYELQDVIFQGDGRFSKKAFQQTEERICLFCNRRAGETAFGNIAHAFPQLMGNGTIISGIECDFCNQRFSWLENDLSNYLGISRTFSGINGTKKAPGFLAQGINAKSRMFLGNNMIIASFKELKEVNSNTFSISYSKNKYTPANVHKALIKAAITVVGNDKILEEHKPLVNYLNGIISISNGALIYDFSFSFNINLPFIAYVFKARSVTASLFNYVVGVSFYNRMMYIPIPNLSDEQTKRFEMPTPAPIRPSIIERCNWSNVALNVVDLSTDDPIVENEEIVIQLDKSIIKGKIDRYDPSTRRSSKSNFVPAEMERIILTKDGVTVNPAELSKFVREIFS